MRRSAGGSPDVASTGPATDSSRGYRGWGWRWGRGRGRSSRLRYVWDEMVVAHEDVL